MIRRAVQSCLQQNFPSGEFELLIIDNNSNPKITDNAYFQNLTTNGVSVKIVVENKQGLAFARIKGINESIAPVIVFVDDDNELSLDYLKSLQELIRTYPDVAAWGPGVIKADYLDGAPDWIKNHAGYLFQEKHLPETKYSSEKGWPAHYPVGSGLVITRTLAEMYKSMFLSGKISLTGRKGTTLASGEDSQIIWTAVKSGYNVGTSPVLKLTHLIPGQRCTLDYLLKLNYNISYSYYSGLHEMFPELAISKKILNTQRHLRLFIRNILKYPLKPLLAHRIYRLELAWLRAHRDFIINTSFSPIHS